MKHISMICLSIFFLNFIFWGSVYYKISGKVVYDGKGIDGIIIYCFNGNNRSKEVKTDSEGNFFFYVKNGKCSLSLRSQKGFVVQDEERDFIIENKNISNIIFFLEKECKISGVVKFDDNTPIKGHISVFNDRGSWTGKIKNDGKYVISGIKASDDTTLFFEPDGVKHTRIDNLVLENEGSELKDINLIIPKRLSIYGKVIDKISKEPIESFMIVIKPVEEEDQFYTDENGDNPGEFLFYNLKSGSYYLGCVPSVVEKQGEDIFYKPQEMKIYLKENEIKEIIFELDRMSKEELKKKYPDMFKEK